MAEVTIVPNYIVGDTKAQNFEDVLDVKRGLEKFFTDCTYGILTSKSKITAFKVTVILKKNLRLLCSSLERCQSVLHV